MSEKLTLRLDENLIASAKAYAKNHGSSLSQLVADYFAQLTGGKTPGPTSDGSVTAQLRGVLRGAAVDESDFRRHLEDKYK